jgi:hypothetical protein
MTPPGLDNGDQAGGGGLLAENRKRKMMELNNYLNEKKAELERYTVEL